MITQQEASCLDGQNKICEKKDGSARLPRGRHAVAIPSWSVFLDYAFELGPFRRQPAGFSDFLQIDSRGRKFCNLRTARGLKFYTEEARAQHVACSPLVHGQEVTPDPIPIVSAVGIVHANQDVHLWLSPESGPVWPGQSCSGMKIG